MFYPARRYRPVLAITTASAVVATTTACTIGPDHENSSLADGPSPVASPVHDGVHTDFVTRPDLADLPTEVAAGPGIDDLLEGYISLSPFIEENDPEDQPIANAIIDEQGDAVWLQNRDHMDPAHDSFYNLQFQEYQGDDVLTWWEGATEAGWGYGEIVFADTSYEEIKRIAPTEGMATVEPDLHEARLTDNDTLLTLYYPPVQVDLTEVGGPEDGWVADGLVQEYDLETGELLFEWSAAEHVPVTASMWDYQTETERDPRIGTEPETPFDYFHVNSVNYDGDDSDTFLVSARNTHAVYSIDRDSGDLNWTVGGSHSDYEMLGESYFSWQHDVQRAEDGTLRILDNAATPPMRDSSRVLYLDLDHNAMTADVADELLPPEPRLGDYMANAEASDSGHVTASWGFAPYFTQFSPDGEIAIDVGHAPYISYRAYHHENWVGEPDTVPVLAVEGDFLFVSWNGATEVEQWRVFAGDSEGTAEFHDVIDRDGFETALPLPDTSYVAVQALDSNADVLAATYLDASE